MRPNHAAGAFVTVFGQQDVIGGNLAGGSMKAPAALLTRPVGSLVYFELNWDCSWFSCAVSCASLALSEASL